MKNYLKKGYLTENFKIFHLKDEGLTPIEPHYHDFYKILIHLQGNASYYIEGRIFPLQPNDIVFVGAGEVHRPILHDSQTYERIIVYVSKDFFESYRENDADLMQCFFRATSEDSHVIRVPSFYTTKLGAIERDLEASFLESDFADNLYREALFLQFMVQLNRAALQNRIQYIKTSTANNKMLAILDYINDHLEEDLSIDTLSERFYLSRYHLMHSFKNETGYSLGAYINLKRLALAQSLLKSGSSVSDACYRCGFQNYSTFSRAYKKAFGCTPRENTPRLADLSN